jgi:hypothetical protein
MEVHRSIDIYNHLSHDGIRKDKNERRLRNSPKRSNSFDFQLDKAYQFLCITAQRSTIDLVVSLFLFTLGIIVLFSLRVRLVNCEQLFDCVLNRSRSD